MYMFVIVSFLASVAFAQQQPGGFSFKKTDDGGVKLSYDGLWKAPGDGMAELKEHLTSPEKLEQMLDEWRKKIVEKFDDVVPLFEQFMPQEIFKKIMEMLTNPPKVEQFACVKILHQGEIAGYDFTGSVSQNVGLTFMKQGLEAFEASGLIGKVLSQAGFAPPADVLDVIRTLAQKEKLAFAVDGRYLTCVDPRIPFGQARIMITLTIKAE